LYRYRAEQDAIAKEELNAALNRHRDTLASNPRTDLGGAAYKLN
jgi:hypothetical protein